MDLLQTFLRLHVPQFFKSELFQPEEEIVLAPSAGGTHEHAVAWFARTVAREAVEELYVSTARGLIIPAGRFVPAATVAPVGHFRDQAPWAPSAGVALVLELPSTCPHRAREPKRLGYAAADIPCYLLVDRTAGRVTLFTDPENGDYTAHTQTDFGKPVDLPAPFSFTLDTAPLR
ncbi:Uma2 family endonuclease [Kitasatospora sp. NPDC057936]|uniref:Uma2 family endonuclease n=1 Tax=Kitasatospora sp. NPDC057936 TaxID=3346283 RepID=UPI0036DB8876